jgi:hypothetical protein
MLKPSLSKKSKYVQVKEYYHKLKNPEKYVGNRPITTRSSYESRFISHYLDPSPDVIKWSSESWIILYKYKIDGRQHKYFVDFWFRHRNDQEFLIEIKPLNQLSPPKPQKRRTKGFINRCLEYQKNQDKWEAANKFCERVTAKGDKKLTFKVLTEKHLGIPI